MTSNSFKLWQGMAVHAVVSPWSISSERQS